jgi:hypothetical protein
VVLVKVVGVLLKEVLPKVVLLLKVVGDNLLNQTHGVLLKVVPLKVDGDSHSQDMVLKLVLRLVGDNRNQDSVVLKLVGDNHKQAHQEVGDNHKQVPKEVGDNHKQVHQEVGDKPKLDLVLQGNSQDGVLRANMEHQDKVSPDNRIAMKNGTDISSMILT